MSIYEFIASNEKLATFEEALADEEIKSYNELLDMGLSEEQINIRGIDLSDIDRNEKIFYIQLPEELQNSPLMVEEDFQNSFAHFLTDKKYIYRISGVERAVPHLGGYIGKYANTWNELELWRVNEDDYTTDTTEIPIAVRHLPSVTLEDLEVFYEGTVPRKLILVQK
ncbi:hypothetical protein [Ornithinibacillus halotolerans]|uniref:Uncharacterized protein n=1 Tax=Ornithinibacillus halotolerans TaxID=1274357 RepID=A0A916WFH3_9BACI|nr:hypothetical protein [Ornithinibacillus halotolerans]GGA92986.1 hypothetical protein GCM10008025_39230 [Ornithinibacillus halotolerans]